ncbi:MAG: hypothetical protein K6A65_08190 [Succinivibrionaceae bacterium]|nr:hypothetical protein [Succinivibrionaceae bacterium]
MPHPPTDPDLSPAERRLLERLGRLQQRFLEAVRVRQEELARDAAREAEITRIRREMIALKEENQHLRETLQAWREGMGRALP